jgi:hypothetical protein
MSSPMEETQRNDTNEQRVRTISVHNNITMSSQQGKRKLQLKLPINNAKNFICINLLHWV